MRPALIVTLSLLFPALAAAAPVVLPASPIDRPIPDYPAKALGVGAHVKLTYTIDTHGPYQPGTEDGQPVDQHQNTIVLPFKPNGDHPPVWLNQHPIYYPREAY